MVYQVDSGPVAGSVADSPRALAIIDTLKSQPLSKHAFDKLFAAAALLFFAPFFVLVTVLILLKDGRPVFFRHERVGRNGRTFGCLKFRTMCNNADEVLKDVLKRDPDARAEWEATQKLRNDPRISRLGHFLRKSSLDELPQLLNVLRGEMSIVGPRPVVQAEAKHYREHFTAYKSVLPGLTGPWQVSGRSDTTYEERVALDVRYAYTHTFLGDVRIVLKTVGVVLGQNGAR